jgi:hypothetical protein
METIMEATRSHLSERFLLESSRLRAASAMTERSTAKRASLGSARLSALRSAAEPKRKREGVMI